VQKFDAESRSQIRGARVEVLLSAPYMYLIAGTMHACIATVLR